MMRNILNFLLPLFVIVCLFLLVQTWHRNYNTAYNKSAIGEAIVKDKDFLPAGNYKISSVIGQQVRVHESWMPDRYVIEVVFKGEDFESTVEESLYNSLIKRDLVDIWYEAPAYWGTAYNVHILDPSKPNQIDELEAIRVEVIKAKTQ